MALSVLISLLAVGGVVGVIVLAYRMIRPSFPVQVNCWFCQMNTKVPFGNRNCWDCPHCEQYNGFDKDGGYNKSIPAQHVQDLNHDTRRSRRNGGTMSPSVGILCDVCNRNQLLKVKQLADFVPFNEANYEEEVEIFKHNLEHVYKLCRVCVASTELEIQQQDELLQSRLSPGELKKLHSTSQSLLSQSYRDWDDPQPYLSILSTILHALSLVCAVSLLLALLPSFLKSYNIKGAYSSYSVQSVESLDTFLVFLGLFLNIFSKLLLGKLRVYFTDGLCAFLWLGLMFNHVFYLQDDHIQSVGRGLMFIGCVATIVMTIVSMLWKRQPRSNSNFSIRRLSMDSEKSEEVDSNTTSSFTGDSTFLGVPAPQVPCGFGTPTSAATFSRPLQREVIPSPAWQEHYPWNSLQSHHASDMQLHHRPPSVISEPARKLTSFSTGNKNSDLNSSFMSTFSEPIRRETTLGLQHSSKSAFRTVQAESFSSRDRPAETSFSSVTGFGDIDLEIDSMNLGGSNLRRHGSGVFGSNVSLNHLMTAGSKLSVPPVPRGRRPLISPAKLGPVMQRSSTPSDLHSVSSPLSQRTLFTDTQSIISDQFSQNSNLWRPSEHPKSNQAYIRRSVIGQDGYSSHSRSNQIYLRRSVIGQDCDSSHSSQRSQSSFCPVDSTTDRCSEKLSTVLEAVPWWQSGYVILSVLALSLFTNMIILYTTVTRV
ncbi:transmembrane protein 201-like [Liolophura sinensis]|uniref:transmembrane protein 201-like n=1 Tax=Liolophura sinensis TaxID=3198878 RepID=UPI0031593883